MGNQSSVEKSEYGIIPRGVACARDNGMVENCYLPSEPEVTKAVVILVAMAEKFMKFEGIYPIDGEKSIYLLNTTFKKEALLKKIEKGDVGYKKEKFDELVTTEYACVRFSLGDATDDDEGERTIPMKVFAVDAVHVFPRGESNPVLLLDFPKTTVEIETEIEPMFWSQLDHLKRNPSFDLQTLPTPHSAMATTTTPLDESKKNDDGASIGAGDAGGDGNGDGHSILLSLPSFRDVQAKREHRDEPKVTDNGSMVTVHLSSSPDPVMTRGDALLAIVANQLLEFESIYPVGDERSIYLGQAKIKKNILDQKVEEGNGRVVGELASKTHDSLRLSMSDPRLDENGDTIVDTKIYVTDLRKIFHIHELNATLMLEVRNVKCAFDGTTDPKSGASLKSIVLEELKSMPCRIDFHRKTLF